MVFIVLKWLFRKATLKFIPIDKALEIFATKTDLYFTKGHSEIWGGVGIEQATYYKGVIYDAVIAGLIKLYASKNRRFFKKIPLGTLTHKWVGQSGFQLIEDKYCGRLYQNVSVRSDELYDLIDDYLKIKRDSLEGEI